jgi:hypothetical protein
MMKSGVAVGGEQQAPAYQRKEDPIIVGRIEQIDDDQERIHGDIDEEMDEKAPLSLVGDDRFAPPGALEQERKIAWAARPIPQPASTQTNQRWSGLR